MIAVNTPGKHIRLFKVDLKVVFSENDTISTKTFVIDVSDAVVPGSQSQSVSTETSTTVLMGAPSTSEAFSLDYTEHSKLLFI